ncbi:MAG TPA: winged helix-turn-helix domain-containing protein [Microvirga sp.]|jgi:TolB-like protein/Flp pilus assembly protein TadD|nr:winged helix-turn-helix domain-containing protein [Microvirga sp.]
MLMAFGDHELDLRCRELRRRGAVVRVEPQVFDLLALLIENRDRIVGKDEILDRIWDGRVVSEAALSSRINAARKAVGDSGEEQRLIRTYHKRGFRFVGAVTARGAQAEPTVRPDLPAVPPPAPRAAGQGRPSVAVLPFVNVNQDPDHDYFAYGLTEDIIRLLGRNRWLDVLTRHSTVQYRGQEIDPREIGATLGVRYVVRGSVRRHGARVRISAELVAAAEGRQLWADVYDLDLPDIFDIQEAMAEQIAAVIEPELASVERERAVRRPPENLDAWDCYQRGLYNLWGFTNPGFAEAERQFRRAIALDPGLARAHAGLAYVHVQMAFYGGAEERALRIQAALEEGRIAVALDERDSLNHCVLGRAYCLQQDYAAAIAQLRHTVALNPSFAQGYFALAFALVWDGAEEEAIALIERATELSPRDPHLWTFHMTRAYAHLAQDELEAAEHFARLATQHPNATDRAFAALAAVQGLAGKDAGGALRQLFARRPDYTLGIAQDDLFFCRRPDFIARYAEGLRRAGVPA